MSTTALFAEVLIIGIQASAWILLLLLTWVGSDRAYLWGCLAKESIKGFEPLATLSLLAGAYALGIIADSFAILMYYLLRPERHLQKIAWLNQRMTRRYSDARLEVHFKENQLTLFFAYMRMRIRIVRGAAFNLIAISVSVVLLSVARTNLLSLNSAFLLAGVFLFCSIVCLITVGLMELGHSVRLEQAKKFVGQKPQAP